MPRQKLPSFDDIEIRSALAKARTAKVPMSLSVAPDDGALEVKPLIPLEALVESEAAMADMRARRSRRR